MPGAPGYLLDTGPLILYARASVAGRAMEAHFGFQTAAFKPLLCVVSVGEIEAFADRQGWGDAKRTRVHRLLDNTVRLSIDDTDVIRAYAKIDTWCHRNGRKLGDNDLWIAAVAHVSGATLVTNDRDFDALMPRFLRRVYIDQKSGSIAE